MKPIQSQPASAVETVSDLAAGLIAVGTGWLRYGLSIGESSLKTSAHTLTSTAQLLAQVADRLRVEQA
jgi:hypothetical protein